MLNYCPYKNAGNSFAEVGVCT